MVFFRKSAGQSLTVGYVDRASNDAIMSQAISGVFECFCGEGAVSTFPTIADYRPSPFGFIACPIAIALMSSGYPQPRQDLGPEAMNTAQKKVPLGRDGASRKACPRWYRGRLVTR
jgi:hypothetical protein